MTSANGGISFPRACQEFCVTVNLRLKNTLQTEGKLPPLSSLSQMVKIARGQTHPRGSDTYVANMIKIYFLYILKIAALAG